MAVIVVLVVINNEMADVGHTFEEVDDARIESIGRWKVLLVLRVEQKGANMKTELGSIFETAL